MAHRGKDWIIRAATTSDADEIYRLKVEAFGASYLPFTIYRSPKSINYLRQLIGRTEPEAAGTIKVAVEDGRTVAYYSAVVHQSDYFLNYIAVDTDSQGKGIGVSLLSDFLLEARLRGFGRVALDVFQGNGMAPEWYVRHEFQAVDNAYHVRLGPAEVEAATGTLSWDEYEFQAALEHEGELGFSKLQAFCGDTPFELGLIAGEAYKLLSYPESSIEQIAAAVVHAAPQRRRELIVSGLYFKPDRWLGLPWHESTRMVRDLSKGG